MPNQNPIFLWYGMVQPPTFSCSWSQLAVPKAHLLKIEILLWTAECHPFQITWEKGEAGLTPPGLGVGMPWKVMHNQHWDPKKMHLQSLETKAKTQTERKSMK